MKKILLILLLLIVQIPALASNKSIPDGLYIGEMQVGKSTEKSPLYIIVANNHISVLQDRSNSEDLSTSTFDFFKDKRYKNTTIKLDGQNLIFKHKLLKTKFKGFATLQQMTSTEVNPFTGFYNLENVTGGIRCGTGINISSDGNAVLSFLTASGSGFIQQGFFGKFSSDGAFEQLKGGYNNKFKVVNITQDESQIIINTTSDLGNFSYNFSKNACPRYAFN